MSLGKGQQPPALDFFALPDLTRARALAEKARQTHAAVGERKKNELATVDAWLAGKQQPE